MYFTALPDMGRGTDERREPNTEPHHGESNHTHDYQVWVRIRNILKVETWQFCWYNNATIQKQVLEIDEDLIDCQPGQDVCYAMMTIAARNFTIKGGMLTTSNPLSRHSPTLFLPNSSILIDQRDTLASNAILGSTLILISSSKHVVSWSLSENT